jgi:hypothetical protein
MNHDYLGLHYQVIDLGVISLGDSQWHSIRDARRDSPTERPDTGDSDDGTRQDICEHRTATHCDHEFSPSSECTFLAVQKPRHLALATPQVIQHLLYPRQTCAHLKFKSPCRSIRLFIQISRGFFLSPHERGGAARARRRRGHEGDLALMSIEQLLRRARQAETATHVDEWLSSPGLQAPR